MAVRAFRFEPPSFPGRLVGRPRLEVALERRWQHRVTTVVAGPGFGKSLLLAEAVRRTAARPDRVDVWLTCEPLDRDADHLVRALGQATGAGDDADAGRLVDAIWAQAPVEVCLVLDDVHEIPAGSDGAVLVADLVGMLPSNGRIVVATRDLVPLPVARLAAAGQLLRIGESDLLLDHDELAELADARAVDVEVLARSGGWPALAELLASAGADLVPEYLWDEVLGRLGPARAELLALFDAVGGGDDEVVSELAGSPTRVDEVVRSVPLVSRTPAGWVELHPLWQPALRRMLARRERDDALLRVAKLHRQRGRYGAAIHLYAETDWWESSLDVLREVGLRDDADAWSRELGHWCDHLPPSYAQRAPAQLARGIALKQRPSTATLHAFEQARAGFREAGDVDGELAALAHEGLVRWWSGDVEGLFGVYLRVVELAEAGSTRAAALRSIGAAAIAHLGADSAGVFAALDDVREHVWTGWLATVRWLRSVAHRRNGDLSAARAELAETPVDDPQREIALLRVDWLAGRVDHVADALGRAAAVYRAADNRYLARECLLEQACRVAWLGHPEQATALYDEAEQLAGEIDNPLAGVLRAIGEAACCVAVGDEEGAAAIVRARAVPLLGQPDAWFWRDRAALALVHVLAPESRDACARERLGEAHLHALRCAEALEAARAGESEPLERFAWPPAGVVRANLPYRWTIELAAAASACGIPAPADLVDVGDPRLRPLLRELATDRSSTTSSGAAAMLAAAPAVPGHRVDLAVIGPLEVRIDGVPVQHPHLRRQRVRELLSHLVARGRCRRDELALELWPDLDDGGRNLRVTLNYLQSVLQPDRPAGDQPFFVRTDGTWIELAASERLGVDVWQLEQLLDEAERAERAGSPSDGLAAYRAALPLWRGEPLQDVPEALWAHGVRGRLRERYVAAALRAGELLLASRGLAEAVDAARHALVAEPASDPAHGLLIRAHVANGDTASARRSLEEYRTAVADLGVDPDPAIVALVR